MDFWGLILFDIGCLFAFIGKVKGRGNSHKETRRGLELVWKYCRAQPSMKRVGSRIIGVVATAEFGLSKSTGGEDQGVLPE